MLLSHSATSSGSANVLQAKAVPNAGLNLLDPCLILNHILVTLHYLLRSLMLLRRLFFFNMLSNFVVYLLDGIYGG